MEKYSVQKNRVKRGGKRGIPKNWETEKYKDNREYEEYRESSVKLMSQNWYRILILGGNIAKIGKFGCFSGKLRYSRIDRLGK